MTQAEPDAGRRLAEEIAREKLAARLANPRYWKDVVIEKIWLSNHRGTYDCDWELRCQCRHHSGYWNARFTANGKRYHWFYSWDRARWYRSRDTIYT